MDGRRGRSFLRALVSSALALSLALATSGGARVQADSPVLRLIHEFDADDTGRPGPFRLPFLTGAEAEIGLAELSDPINFAFEKRTDGSFRVLLLDGARAELTELEVSGAGAAAPARRFSTSTWGLIRPVGLALDPATGDLFVLDDAGGKIIRVGGELGQAAQIAEIDLSQDLAEVRGLAIDAKGHLHLLSPSARELYELDAEGNLLAVRTLPMPASLDLRLMTFAPSTDRTDDSEERHLFLVTAGGVTELVLSM